MSDPKPPSRSQLVSKVRQLSANRVLLRALVVGTGGAIVLLGLGMMFFFQSPMRSLPIEPAPVRPTQMLSEVARSLRPELKFLPQGPTPPNFGLYTYVAETSLAPAPTHRLALAIKALLENYAVRPNRGPASVEPPPPPPSRVHLICILSDGFKANSGEQTMWDIEKMAQLYDRESSRDVLANSGKPTSLPGPLLVASTLPLRERDHGTAEVLVFDLSDVPDEMIGPYVTFYVRELESGTNPSDFTVESFGLRMRDAVARGGDAIIPTLQAYEKISAIVKGSEDKK